MFLSPVVASFNCTSPTPQSLFDELDRELSLRKPHPPVQDFSQPLVISLDITVVGILGVVSHRVFKPFKLLSFKIQSDRKKQSNAANILP